MKKLLIFTAFLAGYLIMSLELLGFRLLAPFFGYSIYVWGSLIGLILAALAGGYYLGGRLSEKKNDAAVLRALFLAASVFLLLVLFTYQPILGYFAGWSVIWGSMAATLAIFALPMVALAATSPIIVRQLAQNNQPGYAAGAVYTWGTIGSLLGTFLTSFVLIPYLGSRLSLYSCFFLALVLLVVWLLPKNVKNLPYVGAIFLLSLFSLGKPALPTNVILETESVYNQIRLIDDGRMVWLTLNSRRPVFMQSAYVKEGTLTNFTLIDLFSIGPMIAPVKNLLVLGMAAGASVRQYQQFFPDVKIDAVEIDAKLIEIAHERFGVSENANLKIFAADARPFLAKSDTKYDAVEIDLFQGSPYIPFYTATEEFFQSVLAHLSERGLLMMNVMAPGKQEILAPMLATIKTVFPSVYTISVNNNFLVLATTQKSNLEEIKKTIADTQTQSSPELKSASGYALDFLKEYQADKKTPVFTDDWAPVELLTYRMLKSARL